MARCGAQHGLPEETEAVVAGVGDDEAAAQAQAWREDPRAFAATLAELFDDVVSTGAEQRRRRARRTRRTRRPPRRGTSRRRGPLLHTPRGARVP